MKDQKLLYPNDSHSNWFLQIIQFIGRNGLSIFNTLFTVFIVLPWLAPVFMNWGWEPAARAIYLIYNPLCHQFPQRSYFLFGEQTMYSLDEIGQVWPNSSNPLQLRQFVGTPEMGWKIAWSDRMVSMYGGILIGSLIVSRFKRWLKPISPWWTIVVIFPMGIDGVTHAISDLFGFKNGFRYHNTWLVNFTHNIFDSTFYIGNAIGSFNWWMRLLSGLIFGIGLMYIILPMILNLKIENSLPQES